ncbi:aminoacetone oxidase family FAD-binding enzyme [bacterium]|nr:aminoacetone oxidase family FAD-binding enzyme [bacterium]
MDIPHSDILIIGGGASGMMAAVAAAEQGARVRILERMDRVGKKLLVTGNSRCNLGNLNLRPEFYYGAPQTFIGQVIGRFGVTGTLRFFEKLGLAWTADEEKRVYPRSGQASAVLDLLRLAMSGNGVDVVCSAQVQKLGAGNGCYTAVLKNHLKYSGTRLILAAGGQAKKDLGSNGSGYALAKGLGHSVIAPFPALVKIRLDSPVPRGLKGVKFQGGLTLLADEKPVRNQSGELMFTEDGLSGIPALQISRHIHGGLGKGQKMTVCVDLFPDLSLEEITADLEKRFDGLRHLTLEQSLITLLNKRLIGPVLKTGGFNSQDSPSSLSAERIQQLAGILKAWSFNVSGTRAWNEAQVTAGGVCTDEIDAGTMQSRIVPGLYFSGEIMDVDGDCGGYNLQWAWSTGYIAGTSAAAGL